MKQKKTVNFALPDYNPGDEFLESEIDFLRGKWTYYARRVSDRFWLPKAQKVLVSPYIRDIQDRLLNLKNILIWQRGQLKFIRQIMFTYDLTMMTRKGQVFLIILEATKNGYGHITEDEIRKLLPRYGQQFGQILKHLADIGMIEAVKIPRAKTRWRVSLFGHSYIRMINGGQK